MNLIYLDEFIYSPNGIPCKVLDTTAIDFGKCSIGRKSKEIVVLKANGQEKIDTITSDYLIESSYLTSPGDAIFCNNDKDMYVPKDSHGQAFKFDNITKYGYEIITKQYIYKDKIAIKVKRTSESYILSNVILFPTCIKDAFGKKTTINFFFQEQL